MKERGELDLLLPDLLGAMGHTVLTRPQRGTRQAGVDCLSEIQGESGPEAFLFILKCGDVERAEFYSSPQGVESSIREARTDYIRNRLPNHLMGARKHIVLLSNGEMKEQVLQGFASLTKEVAELGAADLEFWGQRRLIQLIERHLLDETLFLGEGRSHLRRAIATVERSEVAVSHMASFFSATLPVEGANAKQLDKRFTAAMMGWLVFRTWCRVENNLRPIAIAGEVLLLYSWASAQRVGLHQDPQFAARHDRLAELHSTLLLEYFDKVGDQLLHPRAMHRYRPMRALFLNQVSDEVGRLASLTLILVEVGSPAAVHAVAALARLIESHQGCLLPYFDGQSIDISLALAAFVRAGATQPATMSTASCVDRLRAASHLGRFLPVDSDSFDDALALELGELEDPHDRFQISSYVPMLATAAAELGSTEVLGCISKSIVPSMPPGVTLERWFPTERLETSWGRPVAKGELGVSRAVSIQDSIEAESAAAMDIPEAGAQPDQFQTIKAGRAWVLAISARLFRHPLPPWFFRLMLEARKSEVDQSEPA
jgi:hypothetical protein